MIYDDFNDNALDLARWMVFDDELAGSVNEANSRLEFNSHITGAVRASITSRSRLIVSAGSTISSQVINNVDPAINPFTVAEFGCYTPTNPVGTYQGVQGTGPAMIVGGMFGFRCNAGAGYFTPQVVPSFVPGQNYFLEIEFVSDSQVDMRVDGITLYSGSYVHNPDYAVYCMMDSLGAIPDPVSVYFDDVSIPGFIIQSTTLPAVSAVDLNAPKDIRIVSTDSGFDVAIQGGDLATGHWLVPAIYISLFTDRRAAVDDDIPDGTSNRRGWWADPDLGSKLWLLSRAKMTDETLVKGREYAVAALQWIVSHKLATAVDVGATWGGNNWMILNISIQLIGGPFNQTFNLYLDEL